MRRRSIQLTEAEWAFRIAKNELAIWLVWHQKEDRVRSPSRSKGTQPFSSAFYRLVDGDELRGKAAADNGRADATLRPGGSTHEAAFLCK